MILLDANILLRLIEVGHPHQPAAARAIRHLHLHDGERFVTCPQTLYEMYVVCTRPVDVPNAGLGLTPAAAMAQVESAERLFDLEFESPAVYVRWRELVVRHGVIGKASHDTRLVALMLERGIPRLLTFNDAHFVRYTDISALNPFDVLDIPHV